MKKLQNKYVKYPIFILLSIILISSLSKSTSPFFSRTYSIDSSIFQVIGKGITKGYIPYLDLFDHKGPILFFIQALGFTLNNNIGIYVLQIINCFVTLIFLEKLVDLFETNTLKKIIIIASTLFFYSLFFSEGNLSEEWSLSFILIPFYLNLKSLLTKTFSSKIYIITGISFAIISLIRVNNAATIIGFSIFYFFYLLIQKNTKELLKFIGMFLLGSVIIYVPIILIFFKWNALYEMIYATFLFNFIYGSGSEFNIQNLIIKLYSILPLIYLSFIIVKSNNKKEFKICLHVITFVNAIAVCAGYSYLHYYVILIPLFAILFAHLKPNKNILKLTIIFLITVFYLLLIFYLSYFERLNYNGSKLSKEDALDLKQYISDENSVLAYNVPAKIYLFLDVTPAYKYFTFQSWHSQSNPQIAEELQGLFESKNIKYIITYNNMYSFQNYRLIHNNNSFSLYEIY